MNTNSIAKVLLIMASSIPPCREAAETYEEMSKMEELKDIIFEKIDIDDDESHEVVLEKYRIASVPTFLLLDSYDEPVYKIVGKVPTEDLVGLIDSRKEA